MNEKSYVGMGTYLCPVCTKMHTETVLIDKRFRKTLSGEEHLGMELCEEHQKLKDDGYIALIGIDEENSPTPIDPHTALRSGVVAHIKSTAYEELFDMKLPNNAFDIAMCSDDVIKELHARSPKE